MQTSRRPSFLATSFALLTALAACSNDGTVTDGLGPDATDESGDDLLGAELGASPAGTIVVAEAPELGQLTRVSFSDSGASIVNPERGYYIGVNLLDTGSAARVRSAGHSLAIALVRLDAYRNAPLDAAFLARLDAGFASARAAGIKVILRFMYNADGGADAPRARILEHIAQLKPLLWSHGDVISVMQAGFIGGWGEWHSSTNGNDNDVSRREILRALLGALSPLRVVQIRTPMYKEGTLGGGPLSPFEAWNGSERARVGHHNDCFLASSSDYGTYASPLDAWRGYVEQDSEFTPFGGETCAVYPARTDCAPAQAEMAALHMSYLNAQYNVAVINPWTTQGCGDTIKRKLGYRLAASRLSHSSAVAPGGELVVSLEVDNTGYAAPYNTRPVYLVLRKGTVRHQVRLANEDARTLAPGRSTMWTRLRVPAGLASGDYELALWMPDAASSLQADPRFAIQLANAGVWDATTGLNVLTRTLRVDANASGPRDATATQLIEL